MSNFEVTWITQGESNAPKHYWTKASCGFDAEVRFLEWARYLREPVKVVRVEKVNI